MDLIHASDQAKQVEEYYRKQYSSWRNSVSQAEYEEEENNTSNDVLGLLITPEECLTYNLVDRPKDCNSTFFKKIDEFLKQNDATSIRRICINLDIFVTHMFDNVRKNIDNNINKYIRICAMISLAHPDFDRILIARFHNELPITIPMCFTNINNILSDDEYSRFVRQRNTDGILFTFFCYYMKMKWIQDETKWYVDCIHLESDREDYKNEMLQIYLQHMDADKETCEAHNIEKKDGFDPYDPYVFTKHGIYNAGNTCYLNAILQALFHCPAFVKKLLATTDAAKDPFQSAKGKNLQLFLKELYLKLKDKPFTNTEQNDPGGMLDFLFGPIEHVGRKQVRSGGLLDKTFIFKQQEDAQELLLFLFSHLGDCSMFNLNYILNTKCVTCEHKLSFQSNFQNCLTLMFNKEGGSNFNIMKMIEDFFNPTSTIGTSTTCNNCKTKFCLDNTIETIRKQIEDSKSESELNKEKIETIRKQIEDSTSKSELNKIKIEKEKKKLIENDDKEKIITRIALHRTLEDCYPKLSEVNCILRCPSNLIIQLKRFRYNQGIQKKINDPVLIPLTLTLPDSVTYCCKEDQERPEYELRSIVFQIGSTMISGHYICYSIDDQGNCFCFDDDVVSEKKKITNALDFNTKYGIPSGNEYLLFYSQKYKGDKYFPIL